MVLPGRLHPLSSTAALPGTAASITAGARGPQLVTISGDITEMSHTQRVG